ncbi:uncharacterized protein LOC8080862 [Sorghum bicolor]|uniref:uncharacterized protein LOC8080862 n=1 Tax=Sorghum bicolor TaxID=4558 RepID=UPI000B4261F2|nr:uncharacterized protein LOC8080862 [Sorghum bicolor]|eukprot:XP_002443910.2 uncharacterized protein LOC8080862 [Sorghum bicolor]
MMRLLRTPDGPSLQFYFRATPALSTRIRRSEEKHPTPPHLRLQRPPPSPLHHTLPPLRPHPQPPPRSLQRLPSHDLSNDGNPQPHRKEEGERRKEEEEGEEAEEGRRRCVGRRLVPFPAVVFSTCPSRAHRQPRPVVPLRPAAALGRLPVEEEPRPTPATLAGPFPVASPLSVRLVSSSP